MSNMSVPVYQHLPLDPAWLLRLQEEIIEPDLPIVDPHHHLWERAGGYFLDEILADTNSGHNVVATVFSQCGYSYRTDGPEELRSVGETTFVAAVAEECERRNEKTRICAGIVGAGDLLLGNKVDALLEAHIEEGHGRFRGIRHISARHEAFSASLLGRPQEHLFSDPTFRTGFGRLQAFNMTFDAWLYHTQIDELTALARAFPDTPIVLNHTGGPLGVGPYVGKRDTVFTHWLASMKTLATCPNVHVKLGGLAMAVIGFEFHKEPIPPSSGELSTAWRPYIEACIEHFGADRCMFESNFPVDKGMCSYPVLWNAFKRIASGASATEKASLFHDTASNFYRLAR